MPVKKKIVIDPPTNLHLDKRAARLAEMFAPDDDLMNTKDVASWLEVSEVWLIAGRAKGYGPPFEKMFGDRIAYRPKDVIAWLKQRAREYQKRKAE